MPDKNDLQALQEILQQARLLTWSSPPLPGSWERLHELIEAALSLSNALVESKRAKPAAAVLGKRGGKRTAERGPEYFAKIAAMRKTRAGGRPRKQS